MGKWGKREGKEPIYRRIPMMVVKKVDELMKLYTRWGRRRRREGLFLMVVGAGGGGVVVVVVSLRDHDGDFGNWVLLMPGVVLKAAPSPTATSSSEATEGSKVAPKILGHPAPPTPPSPRPWAWLVGSALQRR